MLSRDCASRHTGTNPYAPVAQLRAAIEARDQGSRRGLAALRHCLMETRALVQIPGTVSATR